MRCHGHAPPGVPSGPVRSGSGAGRSLLLLLVLFECCESLHEVAHGVVGDCDGLFGASLSVLDSRDDGFQALLPHVELAHHLGLVAEQSTDHGESFTGLRVELVRVDRLDLLPAPVDLDQRASLMPLRLLELISRGGDLPPDTTHGHHRPPMHLGQFLGGPFERGDQSPTLTDVVQPQQFAHLLPGEHLTRGEGLQMRIQGFPPRLSPNWLSHSAPTCRHRRPGHGRRWVRPRNTRRGGGGCGWLELRLVRVAGERVAHPNPSINVNGCGPSGGDEWSTVDWETWAVNRP
jgi:hypothetical protein